MIALLKRGLDLRGGRRLLLVSSGMALATAARLIITLTSAHFLSGSAAGRYLTLFAMTIIAGALLRLGLDQNSLRLIARASTTGQAPGTIIKSSAFLLALTSAVLIGAGLGGLVIVVFNDGFHLGVDSFQTALIIVWMISEGARLVFSESLRGFGKTASATFLGDAGRYTALAVAVVILGVIHRASFASFLDWSCVTAFATLLAASGRLLAVEHQQRRATHGQRGHLDVLGVLRGTLPIYVTTVCAMVISQGDTVIVGGTLSHLTAAIYATASRFSLLLVLPLAAVNLAISPALARYLGTKGQQLMEDRVRLVVTVASLVAVLTYVVIVILGQLIVDFVLPSSYHEVAAITAILALGPMATTSTGPNGLSLIMGGRARVAAWTMGIVSVVQVGLMVGAALTVGVFGVAAISSGGSIAQNVLMTYLARRELSFRTESYFTLSGIRRGIRSLPAQPSLLDEPLDEPTGPGTAG